MVLFKQVCRLPGSNGVGTRKCSSPATTSQGLCMGRGWRPAWRGFRVCRVEGEAGERRESPALPPRCHVSGLLGRSMSRGVLLAAVGAAAWAHAVASGAGPLRPSMELEKREAEMKLPASSRSRCVNGS